MKIKDIQARDTGYTKTDEKSISRIGSEIEFYVQPTVGASMLLSYVKDNQGNPKIGLVRTSAVINVIEDDIEIIVVTLNSRYVFEKTNEVKGEDV